MYTKTRIILQIFLKLVIFVAAYICLCAVLPKPVTLRDIVIWAFMILVYKNLTLEIKFTDPVTKLKSNV